MAYDYSLMRSLIYVGLAKEEYRPKLMHWLYYHHVPESISRFQPYCQKYTFYQAYPTPPEGDKFGAKGMQLTEHYWSVNERTPEMANHIFEEYMPMDVLRWQGILPDVDLGPDAMMTGDEARGAGGGDLPPFVFAFIPINWEDDFKGKGRMLMDGPNYRWQFIIQYPEGVNKEDGEKWFREELVPYLVESPYTNRVVSSKVLFDLGGADFDRVVEVWFEGPEEWYKTAVEESGKVAKPEWAQTEAFPYLKPNYNIVSIFTGDMATLDAYTMYRGYITMR